MTVAELRKTYKVFVKHRRYYSINIDGEIQVVGPFSKKEAAAYGYTHREINAKGGSTEVEIFKNSKNSKVLEFIFYLLLIYCQFYC